MRLIYIVLSLLALLAPAQAGMTLSVTTTTAGAACTAAPCTASKSLTDAELGYLAQALQPQCTNQNIVSGVPTACTAQQVITYWFNSVIQRLTSDVNSQLYSQAVKAMTPPPTINPQ